MAAKRKRHDEELLAQCVTRVLAGESATSVSKDAKIPYTTLLGRVSWKKNGYEPAAIRRRQQVSSATSESVTTVAPTLPDVDEQRVLQVMARMQRAGICVRRRDVLHTANEMLGAGQDECDTQWFLRFRERHPEVTGHGTNLLMSDSDVESILAAAAESEVGERAAGVQEVVEEVADDMLTPSQRAVQALQATYASRLDPEDMVEAFDIMADPVTARVFLVIAPGELRDMWLQQRIQKIRDEEEMGSTMTSTVI